MRIRYLKTQSPNVLKSTQIYRHPTNGGQYRVVLDLNSKSWSVVDATTNAVAETGTGPSVALVKIAARNALANLGIVLEIESRNRTPKQQQA